VGGWERLSVLMQVERLCWEPGGSDSCGRVCSNKCEWGEEKENKWE